MKSKIKAIGFDFDGTLIMSEKSKSKEMAKVFEEKFGIKNGVQAHYEKLVGKGYNRKEKVLILFKKFIKQKPTKKELKEVENHFGKHYEKEMKVCPLFQCTNIIKELKKQVHFLFLLSLENKREVKHIAQHCGLAKYFDEILGGPKSKLENLEHVLKKHHLKPNEIIYVGDSQGDVIAGNKEGIKVILIKNGFNFHQLKKKLGTNFVFSSLCNLPNKVENFE
jgi:HAD superfamily hydrolase (TIGR01509 family)